jgi:hypothetical protein
MDVRLPDGTIIRNVPDGMSKADLTAKLLANGYDLSGPAPAAPKPIPERTYGEAAQDVAAKLISGTGSLVQLPGQLYGLATGDFSKTGLLGAGEDIRKYGESLVSPSLKAKEEARAQKIAESEKTGELAAAGTAFGETIKDPALLIGFLVEQVPQLIPALLTGGGTAALTASGIAAKEAAALVASGAAKEAAEIAAKQIAAKKAGELGVQAAVGTGAVQQGADVGAGAYENIYKAAIAKGVPEAEAASIALNAARAAGASGAIISLLAQRLPGARTLEESFAGVPGTTGRILGAGKGALGESAGEVVEEGGGKFSQNLAMREVNPEQSLTEGLGQATGMAAIGGGGMGLVAGAARRPAEAPSDTAGIQGTGNPPTNSPIVSTSKVNIDGKESVKITRRDGSVEIDGIQVTPPSVETLPPESEAPPEIPTAVKPPSEPPKVQFKPADVAALANYTEGLPDDAADVFKRLQNRDRATPASIQQMQGLASNPDYDRLKTSPDFGSGAPVVISDVQIPESQMGRQDIVTASDGRKIPVQYAIVDAGSLLTSHTASGQTNPEYGNVTTPAIRAVAGNGRIAGLQAAYNNKTAEGYVAGLQGDNQHGVDPTAIEGIQNPVLVRIMPKSYITPDIGDVSNVAGQLRLNPVEAAKNDANRFDLQGLQYNEDGGINANSVIQFIRAMPKEEQGELIDKNGAPNAIAFDRLNNAVFFKAYGSDSLIDLYAQAADPEAKLILQGLAKAAPNVSQLEGAGEYDIRPNIIEAAELAVNARRQGVKLKDFVNQGQLGIDPNTMAVLEMFAEHGRSGKRMGELLGKLADKAYDQAQAGDDMFGEKPKLPLADVFKALKAEGEPDLFTPPSETKPAEPTKPIEVVKPIKPKKPAAPKKPVEATKPTEPIKPSEPKELPEPKDFVAKKSLEEIAAEIKGMTGTQLAQWAVDNAPNSAAKAIAEKVLIRIKELDDRGFFNQPVSVLNRDDLSYRGKFTYALNFSFGNLKFAGLKDGKAHRGTGTRYITILHELLHAATVPALATKGKEYNDLSVVLDKVKKQIAADQRAGKTHPIFARIAGGANTIQNVKELISWGLTDPDFQDYLSTVKVGETNAMTRMVEIFRKLLGLDVKYETALDTVVRATDTILDTPTELIEKGLGRNLGPKKLAAPAKPAAANAPPKLTAPAGFKIPAGRNEQVVLAARELKVGNITKQQFDEYVNYYMPVEKILGDKLESPLTETALGVVLSLPKVKKDGSKINADVANGTRVGLRMDIPALVEARKLGMNGSVVSIHEGKPATNASPGKNISYKSAGALKNAVFAIRSEEKSFNIAQALEGKVGQKAPQQTIEGNWVNMTPEEIFKQVKEKLNDPEWSQVSLDPLRHSFFYDRSNTKPVVSADEVLQVGRFVLAKNVKYGKREEFLYEDTGKETADEESVGDKLKAKAAAALQPRKPLAPESFQGVSPDFIDKANPIFAPQKKTIIDRLEGMRDRFWQRLAQGIADQFRTIKEYSEDAYMLARMSKTVDGALEGLMFFGQVFNDGGALNIKSGTKGLIEVLKPLGNEVDRYQMWIALSRESELPPNKRSQIDNLDELVERKDELIAGDIDGKPREQVYKAVRTEMNKLNRSVLKVALDAGLIDSTANAIDRLNARIQDTLNNDKMSDAKKDDEIADLEAQIEELQKNPIGYERFIADINYIPFYREMEDGDVSKVMTASGLSNQQFSKALEGGVSPFADLMENTLRNWSHILSASMKNQAAAATLTAAQNLGGAEANLKVPYYMIDGKVYYRSNDEMVGDGSVKSWMTTAGKGTVKAMVEGQPVHYNVLDPLLLDSIASIGYMGPKSKFLDVARGFKNVLQFGVTISPAFKVNNLIRDSVQAMAVSDLKKNPFANVVNGWALSDQNNPAHMSALAGGALFNFGSIVEGDQAALIKRLVKMGVKEEHILDTPAKIKNQLKKAWDKYQEFGNKSEAANRMALYQQLKDKGYGHLEASFYARDLLDFSMQGSWPAFRLLTQVVPFLNARVQGLYKLGRDGINPTVRVFYNSITGKPIEQTDKQKAESFGIVTSAVCLASLALYFAFKDDEEYKKRDDWDRDNFWWFKLPGMDYALRIPKPFEIGAFGTLAERVAEQIFDQGAEGKQFEKSLKNMITNTFAINLPQFVKPLVDLYANKDSFTGAPIESAGMERLSKQERATDSTSPLAIALGGLSSVALPGEGLSPVQVDYAIKAYFGWLGGTIAQTSHYAVMPFKSGSYPDTKWIDKVSVGLVKSLPANQSKYATAFYESNKEISQAYADMRHYAEIGDSEKVLKILEEKRDKIQLNKFYDKTAKNMSKVRLQIRVIMNDDTMSGAAKREEIDRLKEIISMLAKQAEDTRKSLKAAAKE